MNEEWKNTNRETYTYDENENMLSYLRERWKDEQWLNYTRETYTYDANGNELSHLTEGWKEEQWVNNFRYSYAYDENSNTTLIFSETWDSSKWVPQRSDFISLLDDAGNSYSFFGYKVTLHFKQFITGVSSEGTDIPTSYRLHQNYPNPFNPSTTISFSLPSKSFVTLKVFDLIGREVATIVNEELPPGNHTKQWNADNLSSGVYFYRLQADSFTQTKKLVLLR
jgi:hypothetical protein